MKNHRKAVVIMCVGEPSALNACHGWAYWAYCVTVRCPLYKQGSPDRQLKAAEKQPATQSLERHLHHCINLPIFCKHLTGNQSDVFSMEKRGYYIDLLTHNAQWFIPLHETQHNSREECLRRALNVILI